MNNTSLYFLKDKVMCPLCLELFTDPVTTACGHNFCMDCLQNYWDHQAMIGESPYCPQCQEPFSSRPRLCQNINLGEIAKLAQEVPAMTKLPPAGPNNIPCDFCSSRKLKPIKTCLQCTPSLCETHTQLHYKDKAYRSHQLLEPISDLKARLCLKHHKLQKQNCWAEGGFLGRTRLQEGRRDHEAVPLQGERATKAVSKTRAALVQMGNSIQQNQVKLADLWKQSLWMTGLLENTSDQQFVQVGFLPHVQWHFTEFLILHLGLNQLSPGLLPSPLNLLGFMFPFACPDPHLLLPLADYCNLNFDPNTVSEELLLFKETHSVLNIGIMLESSSMPCQGFNHWPQVLCTPSLCGGCHYWEVEVSDSWLCLGATYSYAHRTGKNYIYLIGRNSTSWCLEWDSLKFSVWHNNIQTVVKGSYYQTVGIFLDYAAGSLTFYGVTNTVNLIYHFLTTFTEPLYPALVSPLQSQQEVHFRH
uniref:Uncharacterized protein n=1 Tax=Crocodylus porosus TaxID=8502 RepID=A0A7M4E523_CROPO